MIRNHLLNVITEYCKYLLCTFSITYNYFSSSSNLFNLYILFNEMEQLDLLLIFIFFFIKELLSSVRSHKLVIEPTFSRSVITIVWKIYKCEIKIESLFTYFLKKLKIILFISIKYGTPGELFNEILLTYALPNTYVPKYL